MEARIKGLVDTAEKKADKASVQRYQTRAIGVSLPGSRRYDEWVAKIGEANKEGRLRMALIRVEHVRPEGHDDDYLAQQTSAYLYGRGCIVEREIAILADADGQPDYAHACRPDGALDRAMRAARF